MDYLLLWSGDVPGMTKARIPSKPAPGICGHLDETGKLVCADLDKVREALPARYRPAFDRAGGVSGNGLWYNADRPDWAAHMDLELRSGKVVRLYLQPLTKERDGDLANLRKWAGMLATRGNLDLRGADENAAQSAKRLADRGLVELSGSDFRVTVSGYEALSAQSERAG